MRKDLKDVIVNAGRVGKRSTPRKLKNVNHLPEYEGMKKRWSEGGWDWSHGDRINPLVRMLYKNVGRSWNEVWSEICQTADRRTLRGIHLRQHVQNEVLGAGGAEDHYPEYCKFCIDDNGILQKNKLYRWHYGWKQYNHSKDDDKYEIDGHLFERFNGCWFECYYGKEKRSSTRWDYTKEEFVHYPYEVDVVVKKRQLSKKELKTLGLSNNEQIKKSA